MCAVCIGVIVVRQVFFAVWVCCIGSHIRYIHQRRGFSFRNWLPAAFQRCLVVARPARIMLYYRSTLKPPCLPHHHPGKFGQNIPPPSPFPCPQPLIHLQPLNPDGVRADEPVTLHCHIIVFFQSNTVPPRRALQGLHVPSNPGARLRNELGSLWEDPACVMHHLLCTCAQ